MIRKQFGRRLASLIMVLLIGLVAVFSPIGLFRSAYAKIDEQSLYEFGLNGIYFWDPSASNCVASFRLGSVEASGEFSENAVYVMAYLVQAGYSVEAAAAIVGNLKAEGSAFNPGEAENGYASDITSASWRLTPDWACYGRCGFGIAQWTTAGRQQNLQDYADAKGMAVTSIELQAEFLAHELQNGYNFGPEALNSLSIEEATFKIYKTYEAPRASFATTHNGKYYNDYNPKTLAELSETATPAAYQEYMKRLSFAYGALDVISENNLASVASSGTEGLENTTVTIIGDEITETAAAELLAKLPSAKIYSQEQKPFYLGTADNPGGYEILSELVETGELGEILVYELGTRGSFTLAQAKEVVQKAGAKTKIFFVNNYAASGADFTANNNVLAELADNYINVSVINWASLATKEGAMENSVLPSATGAEILAEAVAQAVQKTLSKSDTLNTCSSTGYDFDVQTQIINGVEYVFPLAGATKANYLNPGGRAGESWLSRLPCGAGNVCHHDYPAVDLGVRKKLVDGTEYTSADFSGQAFSDLYYYSTGVKVLAFVGGTITRYTYYSNGTPADYVEKCASVTFAGDDGKTYWLGHMSYDSNIKAGDHFAAGEIIGEIGPPQCAQNTQAHLHINVSPQSANDRYIIDLMDKLYEGLPNE